MEQTQSAAAYLFTQACVVDRELSSQKELKSRGSSKKQVAKNGLAAKNKLGHKKLNCEAGIDS
jgi:hypothetical protein